MQSPLNASATTAGSLFSTSAFEVPPYQREYAWEEDEVSEFWSDLQRATGEDSYFLGLLILTEEGGRKHVVDGQQRLLTLTLLAASIYHQAIEAGRKALADRLHSDFLTAIDYQTDLTRPRVVLSDQIDNLTLQSIIESGLPQHIPLKTDKLEKETLSARLRDSYQFLNARLREDLQADPFKRLGVWTDFITNRLYFAVFVHPDSSSAYRVFEVINTRGKELTTADLLKNYVLSQTASDKRAERYAQWQVIAKSFASMGSSSLVQYIRHVVTVKGGHILPKDLFDFVARRQVFGSKNPPTIPELLTDLEANLPLYLQMIDPTLSGPADAFALKIFSALDQLGVISVRPLLLSIMQADESAAKEGMSQVLRLVVRRIVAGNLGTGNVERILGEAARLIHETSDWQAAASLLRSLDPTDEAFLDQLKTRSFNKAVLAFLRRSLVQRTMTPENTGVLHFVAPRQQLTWDGLTEEKLAYWGGTIANTVLANMERRPKFANNWVGVKEELLGAADPNEFTEQLLRFDQWDENAIEEVATHLSLVARDIWC